MDALLILCNKKPFKTTTGGMGKSPENAAISSLAFFPFDFTEDSQLLSMKPSLQDSEELRRGQYRCSRKEARRPSTWWGHPMSTPVVLFKSSPCRFFLKGQGGSPLFPRVSLLRRRPSKICQTKQGSPSSDMRETNQGTTGFWPIFIIFRFTKRVLG